MIYKFGFHLFLHVFSNVLCISELKSLGNTNQLPKALICRRENSETEMLVAVVSRGHHDGSQPFETIWNRDT